MTFQGREGGKVCARLNLTGFAGVDQTNVKAAINIPHERAHVDDGLITYDRPNTDFVKGMSHELRTPLNVIIGMCQLLERDRKTPLLPIQRDAVDRMERNARALLETVNHLLECLRSGHLE
jgi:signal transduction histidine kinase